MDDILLLEAIERYLSDDMSAEERTYFENLRKNTPEIDQMVVEHNMFLHQMDMYAAHRTSDTVFMKPTSACSKEEISMKVATSVPVVV